MDLNALSQLSALVVAVLNAHADPLTLLNPHPDILTSPHNNFPFKLLYSSLSLSLSLSLFIALLQPICPPNILQYFLFEHQTMHDSSFLIVSLGILLGRTASKAQRRLAFML